jgi:prefoldin subunit 5
LAAEATQSKQAQEPQAGTRKQKTGRSVVRPEVARGVARGAQGADQSASTTEDRRKPVEGTAPAAVEREAGQPQQPSGQEPGDRYAPGKYFEFEGMPAGLTPEQINEAWQRVESELEGIERRKTQLDGRERELQELAADVARRQKELGHERTRIAEEHLRLDARIEKFEEQIKLVRKDEASAYKRNAMTLSALGSSKAAELISDQWKTDRGQNEVLKLLEFMDEDDLAGILELLPTATVQDLMSKRLRVTKEAAPSGSRK